MQPVKRFEVAWRLTDVLLTFRAMPYERIILGPRYAVRLEALQATDAIAARCMGCGRSWCIAPHRLHDRHWPYTRLVDIGAAMRCTSCGPGAGMIWEVVRASPPAR